MTDSPLRIVHVVRSPVGGIFRHIADLATAQAAAGHQVGLVFDSLTCGAFEAEKVARLEPHLELGAVRLPIARQISPSDIGALSRVRAILAPLSPDVIHAHGAKGGVFGRLVGAWLGRSKPVARFYAPHGGSLHYDRGSLEGRIYFTVERALERITDALIHVSDYERIAYLKKVGTPQCDAVVVRNGLTPPEFEPVSPAADAADFLFLGMLRDLKGPDVFLEAIRKLSTSPRPVTGIVVGDGPDETRYHDFVGSNRLGHLVTFRPPTPTRKALALGRAIVVPSRAESMPYVVLEAIAAGVPILASSVGGIPEIFGPLSGELLPPGDADRLAMEMAAVAEDPAKAAAAATDRRQHIETEFSLTAMASKIESVYRVGINRRRARD